MANEFWNGNKAAAEAVRLCDVKVVAAYPITPQTTLVEHIASFVSNALMDARMIAVESEHSAMSACAGASSVGARTFTASSSQGIIYMSEVLHMTSGCRLPVVMAVVHRAISAPVNISSDQQDSMLVRDAGWVILECCSAQEVHDTIPIAYRIAEDPSVHLPVMVCFDGFTISHTSEEVESLSSDEVDVVLGPVSGLPRPVLDVSHPFQLNQLLTDQAYSEYQYKKHMSLRNAEAVIGAAYDEFAKVTGRYYPIVESYLCDDAEIIFIGMGSVTNTVKWVVNNLRKQGEKVGIVTIRELRPFPEKALLDAVRAAKLLAVIEKNIGLGTSGMMFPDVVGTFCNGEIHPKILNFIVGLGGRSVMPEAIEKSYRIAMDAMETRVAERVFWPDTDLEGL